MSNRALSGVNLNLFKKVCENNFSGALYTLNIVITAGLAISSVSTVNITVG